MAKLSITVTATKANPGGFQQSANVLVTLPASGSVQGVQVNVKGSDCTVGAGPKSFSAFVKGTPHGTDATVAVTLRVAYIGAKGTIWDRSLSCDILAGETAAISWAM